MPRRGIGGGVLGVDRVQRPYQDRRGCQAAEPLMVGRHYTPRPPLRARLAQHDVEGLPVLVPVAPLPHITGRELPVLIRMVDALEEARTSTACGLTPLITCWMVLRLRDASSPCKTRSPPSLSGAASRSRYSARRSTPSASR